MGQAGALVAKTGASEWGYRDGRAAWSGLAWRAWGRGGGPSRRPGGRSGFSN